MWAPKKDQLIRLVSSSSLGIDVAAFLLDRKARGLSPRTIQYYGDELHHLRDLLADAGISEILGLTSHHLRNYPLYLGRTRNPGGVHAAYRAVRAFLSWREIETEPDGWVNPIRKVRPPKVPQMLLEPLYSCYVIRRVITIPFATYNYH
ncbi:MAG: site-specific integrase [Chloroflexi bacterium]|nr:site-specific integrase [Chloroflexota bacterium]